MVILTIILVVTLIYLYFALGYAVYRGFLRRAQILCGIGTIYLGTLFIDSMIRFSGGDGLAFFGVAIDGIALQFLLLFWAGLYRSIHNPSLTSSDDFFVWIYEAGRKHFTPEMKETPQ